MEHQDTPAQAGQDGGEARHATRIAFERLRERTDELELLVSGLFAFALLALPPRILDAYQRASVHVDGVLDQILRYGYLVGAGLCYALAVAFIVHLSIRAYWVGVIGLKSTFPDGIRWDRLPLVGPVTRGFYQRSIGGLDDMIDGADRAASIVFAMTTLMALVIAWTGLYMVLGLLAGWLAGGLFADRERAAIAVFLGLAALLMLVGLGAPFADRVAARREAAGRDAGWARRLGERVLRIYGWLIPQRLVYTVQYTLQSNLPNRRFMFAYTGGIVFAFFISSWVLLNHERLAYVDSYRVLGEEAAWEGMHSAHYEAMREGPHRSTVVPMIPSDRVADTHLRLFIPHRPQRDNDLARERCEGLVDGRNEATGPAAADLARRCLASLWTVALDGAPVPLDDFVASERQDLGMRGLTGYIEVGGLRPGLHRLELAWNPEGGDSGRDRRRTYRIPFWFTPGIDQPHAAP